MEGTEPRAARDHSPVLQGLALIGVLAAAMWIVEGIDQVAGGSLDQNGIQPREVDAEVARWRERAQERSRARREAATAERAAGSPAQSRERRRWWRRG